MKSLLPLVGAVLLVSACGKGGPTSVVSLPTQPTPTVSSCPAVTTAPFAWPSPVPPDLPQPPTATFKSVSTKNALTVVRFTTKTSLRDGVLFLLREVQKAGFELGRGDAEPAEADAPFGRGDVRGIYKMVVLGECSTDWLVAVTRKAAGSGSPVLPTASRGPSSSPLPFG